VIRFEREGEARLARWLGEDDWQHRPVLDRLFTEAEAVAGAAVHPAVAGDRAPGRPAHHAAAVDSGGR
jgi:hypothetical protein